jgi:hypothetical protein
VWLFGTTGSLKSTAVALAMCHFGTFAFNTPPASWTGTTNALEKKAFLVKDAPLWIDDYAAQATVTGQRELRAKSDQLLRDWGNRAGRGRMRADLKLRRTFVPRGLIISTAEQLPPGPSLLPRLFAIEIGPEMMTRGEGSALTRAQAEDAPRYARAMAGYVRWLSAQWPQLAATLPESRLRFTERARMAGEGHLRVPGNVATMFLGFTLGLEYAQAVGAIDEAQENALHAEAWNVLLGAGEAQCQIVVEERPVELYIDALQQMFAQGVAYLRRRDRQTGETPDEDAWPADRAPKAQRLGWYDDEFWYLLPGATYNAVCGFYRDGGTLFPDRARGIQIKLVEEKKVLPDGKSRTYQLPFASDYHPRVLRLYRPE